MPPDSEITPQLEALLETLSLLAVQARASQQALPSDQVQARLALAVLERLARQATNEARDILVSTAGRACRDPVSTGSTSVQPEHLLTPREMEVLRLASEGLTNKEIAYRLGLSERTVQYHLNSVYNKTSTNSRAEATAAAFKRGWL
jgi:DNA-binding NarL/FixJ family response regulator